MKTGKSIVELAQELTRINEVKKDYIVPVSKLEATVVNVPHTTANEEVIERKELALSFVNGSKHDYRLNNWSSGQLATFTDIPKAYFDRIASENPSLAASNVNHGLAKQSSESRMIRTLDGKVRGMLSSRYRVLDAHDMLETVFPVMAENQMQLASSEITDQRMYIKALSPKLQTEIKKGDVVQYGLTISTSDVGAGSVRVEPLIFRLVCSNGMISNTALRKYHVGRNQQEIDIRELLSDKTKEITDQAFWMQVRDLVLASMKPENFEREADKLRIAAGLEIKNFDLPEVVELTMKAVNVTGEKKKNSILAALASGNEGAGLNQWGLINSFTRAAQGDEFSYEESIEMERAAGKILELPKSQWNVIANAI